MGRGEKESRGVMGGDWRGKIRRGGTGERGEEKGRMSVPAKIYDYTAGLH